jgi:hypothetical protein
MSSSNNCHYLPLIQSFDAVGWVPTIRGSLSLSLFDNSNSILGDVDKFSIEFKNYYNNFVSSRYLAASSLFATDDYKVGKDYCRTFRYVFRGTINDTQRKEEFISNNHLDSNFFENKDLLIGKLSIIVNVSNNLTGGEIELLKSLKTLSEKKQNFVKEFSQDAVSCERLQQLRNELKRLWDTVEANIKNIETTEAYGNPIYKFDVVLSKDGILFLKDDTANYLIGKNNNDTDIFLNDTYRQSNTPSDFTQNIPIHRLFKTAMNYIKFLFHKNYHHKEDDDTFLPATNLYPIRTNPTEIKIEKIIRHQIEAFLCPITALKRDNFHNFSCNPLGIIEYADSFLYVFENNGFISNTDADIIHKFIDKQKNDIEILLSENNTIIGSFLTQKNMLATITVSIAFLLATMEICYLIYKIPEVKDILHCIGIPKWITITVVICCGLLVGWLLKKMTEKKVLAKRFKIKDKSNNIFNQFFNQDSNIRKRRFSRLYALWLWLIDIKLQIKDKNRELIKGFLLLLLILFVIISVTLNIYFMFH